MRASLFEAMGVADQERIHTQLLAWLLSDRGPLDVDKRRMLLSQFFERELSPEDVLATRVSTELNHLDLVVMYPGGLVGLENKMKARASRGQLAGYAQELNAIAKALGHARGEGNDLFLTFSGEDPLCDGWKKKSYDELLAALRGVNSSDAYVVDYVEYLGRLVEFRDEFLTSHTTYTEVFRGSGMSSIRRLGLSKAATPLEEFVCSNRLERIFVEILFRRMAQKAGIIDAHVDESNGSALIHLNLFRVWIPESENVFRAGLQIQGDTMKLNIGAEDYQESEKTWLTESLECALDAAMRNQRNSVRTNASRSKAYRSWSEPVANPIRKVALPELAAWYRTEVISAFRTWRDVLRAMKLAGVVQRYMALQADLG